MSDSPSGERITTGELGRRLDSMHADSREQFAAIRQEIKGLAFVSREQYAAEQKAQDEKIAQVMQAAKDQSTQRATDRRLALTSLAAPVIVAIVVMLLSSLQ